jgi:A/G-specific adenine glycosylase
MVYTHQSSFASTILNWHATIDRQLPWKTSSDPYKIWLSEIIMQQTRVAQGTPYYLKFIEAFPTVIDLANASESQVMKLWEGLGYYSRARNLHFSSKIIRDKYNGVFPTNYKDILALKGIGQYTAAAISSFAFGMAYPVVDGNVIRVLSRYFGITEAVDASQTLKEINRLAEELIKDSPPGEYNQAVMDFGALMCTPKSPDCLQCPLNHSCAAYATNQVETIPFKAKKIKKKLRHLHYLFVADANDTIALRHRSEKDIWRSLYDFPCIENESQKTLSEALIENYIAREIGTVALEIRYPSKTYKHILTHQTIYGQFYKVIVSHIPKQMKALISTQKEDLPTFAFPVLLKNYLADEEELTLF